VKGEKGENIVRFAKHLFGRRAQYLMGAFAGSDRFEQRKGYATDRIAVRRRGRPYLKAGHGP